MSAWAQSQQPTFRQQVAALAAIAAKLAALHSAGLAHRALRPDCVLWVPDLKRWALAGLSCVAPIGQDAPLTFSLRSVPRDLVTRIAQSHIGNGTLQFIALAKAHLTALTAPDMPMHHLGQWLQQRLRADSDSVQPRHV